MLNIIFWTIIFSVSGTATIVLLGDRSLLSGSLLNFSKFLSIIFHWRFIVAIVSAFIARYSFMIINNHILKIPSLAQNSTSITSLVTSVSLIFLLAANYAFLGEKLNIYQGIGAVIILLGAWIILR